MRLRAALLLVSLVVAGCSNRSAVRAPRSPVAPGPATPQIDRAPAPAPPASPKPARKKPVPEQAPASDPQPHAASFVLAPVLTPQQRDRLAPRIDELLRRAEENLSTLRSRHSDQNLQRELARIASFLRQAWRAKQANDLSAALTLAERAEILSRNLL